MLSFKLHLELGSFTFSPGRSYRSTVFIFYFILINACIASSLISSFITSFTRPDLSHALPFELEIIFNLIILYFIIQSYSKSLSAALLYTYIHIHGWFPDSFIITYMHSGVTQRWLLSQVFKQHIGLSLKCRVLRSIPIIIRFN